MFKKENIFYFLVGSMVTFLVSIFWIWTYDSGKYPGFVYLQSLMGAIFTVLLVLALIVKTIRFSRKKMEGKLYSKKYVASSDTKVYHKAKCIAANKIEAKNKEFAPTLARFKNKKYKPCDLCMVK